MNFFRAKKEYLHSNQSGLKLLCNQTPLSPVVQGAPFPFHRKSPGDNWKVISRGEREGRGRFRKYFRVTTSPVWLEGGGGISKLEENFAKCNKGRGALRAWPCWSNGHLLCCWSAKQSKDERLFFKKSYI